MNRNVGSTERYVRLASGIAAASAAAKTTGWPRAALGAMATAGIGTGLTQYCPLNQAVGRDTFHQTSTREQGRRDAELRRETAVRGALGLEPSAGADRPPVTRQSDVFGSEEASGR